jgi:hypothetical protein
VTTDKRERRKSRPCEQTFYRKKKKPSGACSNAWCRRPPTPGMKTCEKCRDYSREYHRRLREACDKPPPKQRQDAAGRFI